MTTPLFDGSLLALPPPRRAPFRFCDPKAIDEPYVTHRNDLRYGSWLQCRHRYVILRHIEAAEGERWVKKEDRAWPEAETMWRLPVYDRKNEKWVGVPKGVACYVTDCLQLQEETRKGRKNHWRPLLTGGRGGGHFRLVMPEPGMAQRLLEEDMIYHESRWGQPVLGIGAAVPTLRLANGQEVPDPRYAVVPDPEVP